MAPTMVFDQTGQLRYCVGAPGGTAINLAILQVREYPRAPPLASQTRVLIRES